MGHDDWRERYDRSMQAQQARLEQDPDRRWHAFRAIVPLVFIAAVHIAWAIDALAP